MTSTPQHSNRPLLSTPLYIRMSHYAEINDFRQATAKIRANFMANAERLDELQRNEKGKVVENRRLSDRGCGALRLYAGVSLAIDGESPIREMPAWRMEFDRTLQKLNPTERRIVQALLMDFRPQFAARIAGTSRVHVWRTVRKLRGFLAEAHRLWLAPRDRQILM